MLITKYIIYSQAVAVLDVVLVELGVLDNPNQTLPNQVGLYQYIHYINFAL